MTKLGGMPYQTAPLRRMDGGMQTNKGLFAITLPPGLTPAPAKSHYTRLGSSDISSPQGSQLIPQDFGKIALLLACHCSMDNTIFICTEPLLEIPGQISLRCRHAVCCCLLGLICTNHPKVDSAPPSYATFASNSWHFPIPHPPSLEIHESALVIERCGNYGKFQQLFVMWARLQETMDGISRLSLNRIHFSHDLVYRLSRIWPTTTQPRGIQARIWTWHDDGSWDISVCSYGRFSGLYFHSSA